MRSLHHKPDKYPITSVSRRDCLRYMMCGWGLMLTMPLGLTRAAEVRPGPSLLEKYEGEKLRYQIGYGLIEHVGDAETGFLPTDVADIYRISGLVGEYEMAQHIYLTGENLNVISKTLGPAMKNRDPGPIREMAERETEAGVDFIDYRFCRRELGAFFPYESSRLAGLSDSSIQVL